MYNTSYIHSNPDIALAPMKVCEQIFLIMWHVKFVATLNTPPPLIHRQELRLTNGGAIPGLTYSWQCWVSLKSISGENSSLDHYIYNQMHHHLLCCLTVHISCSLNVLFNKRIFLDYWETRNWRPKFLNDKYEQRNSLQENIRMYE
jgi:hypothetical protein